MLGEQILKTSLAISYWQSMQLLMTVLAPHHPGSIMVRILSCSQQSESS
jgi:hypothetical protein